MSTVLCMYLHISVFYGLHCHDVLVKTSTINSSVNRCLHYSVHLHVSDFSCENGLVYNECPKTGDDYCKDGFVHFNFSK